MRQLETSVTIHPSAINVAQLNDWGQVVWYGSDGQDYEIYRNTGGGVQQITNNSYDDEFPRINFSGQVVWQGWDGTDDEILTIDVTGQNEDRRGTNFEGAELDTPIRQITSKNPSPPPGRAPAPF